MLRIIQKEIEELIKMAVVEAPIDLSKFTSLVLEKILPKVKDQLGLEFDKVKVYPGPQPRESSDILLYKNGRIIEKINQKTCISGNLEATVRKLKKSLKYGENGLIVTFANFYRKEEISSRMIIFYIPRKIIINADVYTITETLMKKITEKAMKENYEECYVLAFDEALAIWRTYQVLKAVEKAAHAEEMAKKAYEEAKKANKKIKELSKKLDTYMKLILSKLEKSTS